ncbi:MAG: hypothetical protein A2452_05515 [Candidatus Firestonebacteria bacterium RIFOXYC2_FULL_39_67]|nr:MAG: hypothetical protein A2536_10345 [Candidatus Firestonebacteria bacterium RIFOXYD2_FULL_39_29]OGF56397.1 MAG: hypothetical protein A2452_05515 [Candidatus Firestonebacteria bacterium RIFOXYC2_FULL_39_67]
MKINIMAVIAVAILLNACSFQRVAVKKGYDFSGIKRIAVLGFTNNLEFKNSGDVVADEFVMQLLNKSYSVIERGRINAILNEQELGAMNKLDPSTIKKVGKILGVDAILTGSVVKYLEDSNRIIYFNDKDGNPISQSRLQQAEVSITARLFDVETGEVVWSGSNHDSGFEISDAVYSVVSGLVYSIK